MFGTPEIILIGVAVGIFFFGGKKVKEWARDLGSAKHEFVSSSKGEKIVNTPIVESK